MPMLALLVLLLLNRGNGQNDPSISCPFRLYCTEHGTTVLKLPAVPVSVKLLVRRVDDVSKTLEVYDPENCLPELLLRLNYSSFYPFGANAFEELFEPSNITFFDCSSIGQRHLRNREQAFSDAQDMLSCPIYTAEDYDDVVESDLVSCTKLFRRVLPVPAFDIQSNSLTLRWSKTNFDRRCFVDCKKSGKERKSVSLAATGEKRAKHS